MAYNPIHGGLNYGKGEEYMERATERSAAASLDRMVKGTISCAEMHRFYPSIPTHDFNRITNCRDGSDRVFKKAS